MTTFIVEKGIPVAERRRPVSSIELPEWEVGDSFVVDTRVRASYLTNRFKARGQKVTCRKIDGGKIRIWRTA